MASSSTLESLSSPEASVSSCLDSGSASASRVDPWPGRTSSPRSETTASGEAAQNNLLNVNKLLFVEQKPSARREEQCTNKSFFLDANVLRGYLSKPYSKEKKFERGAFAGNVDMIQKALNACPAGEAPFTAILDDANEGIYVLEFNDPRKREKNLYVGLMQQSHEGPGAKLRPDLAIVLLKLTNEGKERVNKAKAKASEGLQGKKEGEMAETNHKGATPTLPPLSKKNVKPSLYKRKDFAVDSYFAIAELKIQAPYGPHPFTLDTTTGKINNPYFAQRYDFLTQEMSYALRLVWRGLSRYGLTRKEIPVIVLVGKGKVPDNEQLRFMDAVLIISDLCCHHFHYRINNFGTFPPSSVSAPETPNESSETSISSIVQCISAKAEETNKEAFIEASVVVGDAITGGPAKVQDASIDKPVDRDEILEQMILVCRDLVRFGLDAASEALEILVAMDDCPIYKPLSGRNLIIEGLEVLASDKESDSGDVLLYASDPSNTTAPLRVLATAVSNRRKDNSIHVSLADLFEGTLDGKTLRKLYNKPRNLSIESLWFQDFSNVDDTLELKVLVKASSCAAHHFLVQPDGVVKVLTQAKQFGQSLEKHISKSVLVIFKLPSGLVTIMHDLRKKDYRVLHLSKSKDLAPEYPLTHVWSGVDRLVEEALLPYANLNVVHCDIRPGYDVTSNILVKIDKKDGTLDLTVIDCESFTTFSGMCGLDTDGRFVPSHFALHAVGYLWWQCLSLALVWGQQIYQRELEVSRRDSVSIETILNSLVDRAEKLKDSPQEPQQEVKEVLVQGKRFLHKEITSWLLCDKGIRSDLAFREKQKTADSVRSLLERVKLLFAENTNAQEILPD